MEYDYTSPRLYVKGPLAAGAHVQLDENATHYLKNVRRVGMGDVVRVFDGSNGEYIAAISASSDKKSVTIAVEKKIREQPKPGRRTGLIFPPLKKEAMDFLIEKATELGVDDFYPAVSAQSDVRALNHDRLVAQIIAACAQCERLTIPVLHPLMPLEKLLGAWPQDHPIIAAIERLAVPAPFMPAVQKIAANGPRDVAFLIGPAGGFRAGEKEMLMRLGFIHPVTLGDHILRAETAATAMLAAHYFMKGNHHDV